MTVNEIIHDAISSFVDADRLASDLPPEHQAAFRALISGLVGIGQAIVETNRDLASRLEPHDAPLVFERPARVPLVAGME